MDFKWFNPLKFVARYEGNDNEMDDTRSKIWEDNCHDYDCKSLCLHTFPVAPYKLVRCEENDAISQNSAQVWCWLLHV